MSPISQNPSFSSPMDAFAKSPTWLTRLDDLVLHFRFSAAPNVNWCLFNALCDFNANCEIGGGIDLFKKPWCKQEKAELAKPCRERTNKRNTTLFFILVSATFSGRLMPAGKNKFFSFFERWLPCALRVGSFESAGIVDASEIFLKHIFSNNLKHSFSVRGLAWMIRCEVCDDTNATIHCQVPKHSIVETSMLSTSCNHAVDFKLLLKLDDLREVKEIPVIRQIVLHT